MARRVKLERTQVEKLGRRYNGKLYGYFVTAYAITDNDNGEYIVFPFFTGRRAKKEAIEYINTHNMILVER